MTGSIRLMDQGQSVVPAYGTLRVDGSPEPFESPLNERGEFYLENVPPGTRRATVYYRGDTCTFTLTVPTTSATNIDLGVLQCRDISR